VRSCRAPRLLVERAQVSPVERGGCGEDLQCPHRRSDLPLDRDRERADRRLQAPLDRLPLLSAQVPHDHSRKDQGGHEREENERAWKVPADESKKKNPVKADAASIGKGKKTYAERCAICHGEKADGKGASASALNPPPASFLDKKYMAANSDGDLFYKTSNGRGMMPRWDIVLEENDIWSVVNYMRSLGKK